MPSFNPLGSITGKNSATLFEIRLDSDIIILRGEQNDAAPQIVKGVVVLCLPASLRIEDVHLRMTGQLKISWNTRRETPHAVAFDDKPERVRDIYNHAWKPFVGPGSSSKGITLPSGNYEWPFEVIIPGNTPESVEGLPNSHLVYKLKATVARGKLAYDLHAWKPLRIVRTMDPSALELAHAMTVENIWVDKIEYKIEIPTKAIIFGTWIDVEMRFTSLLKGLKIGKIKCVLVEVQKHTLAGQTKISPDRDWTTEREIDTWRFEVNDEHYQDILDDNGQDGWVLKEKLPLPKTLSRCVQTVDVRASPVDSVPGIDGGAIQTKHKVRFFISLINPDGHTSELRAVLPITIFISPNMPLTPEGQLVDQSPMSTQTTDMVQHAPPLYGEHILDQLYADVDQSGLMTPAPQSGMNTPFYSHSRGGSADNLETLHGESPPTNGAPSPAALSSRLQNLHMTSRNSSFNRGDSASGANSPYNALSRRTSEEDNIHTSNLTTGMHTPEHLDYSELAKVPSYQTAVKASPRGLSYDASLPNYETATAPPSPAREYSNPIASASVIANWNGNQARMNPLASIGFTAVQQPLPVHLGLGDESRRLHLIQSRGRAH